MDSESNSQIVRIGLIQRRCTEDASTNLEDAVSGILEAANQGAKVICLQELFLTPYFCQKEDADHFSQAESIPGPTTEKLSALAMDLNVVLIIPLFEKRSQGLYHNTAVVIDADGSVRGKYRKMHIPDDPGFYEKYYFSPGDLGFQSFDTRFGKIGVLICWDQWFPEAARLTALSGAQILFYPTAIGFDEDDRNESEKQISAWQTIQRSHAIANGVYVAATNRVGKEDNITFWGHSFVSDPFGEVTANASDDQPEVVIADCDLSLIDSTRQGWPFLRDRRVDAYSPLSKLYLDNE